jgi:hypothetical protein
MAELDELFPGLRNSGYKRTSPRDIRYNCIAWSVGDTEALWWPDEDSHWPMESVRLETLAVFVDLYLQLGFQTCDDSELEPRYEKVAIYASSDGVPTHAAKLLENGLWSSKLGELEDIEHRLEDLVGEVYGDDICFRPRGLPTWRSWFATLCTRRAITLATKRYT